MHANLLSIPPMNLSKSCDIHKRFLNAVLKMKCEREMWADCKGDMNKSKASEWSFVCRQTAAHTKHHCCGVATHYALTSGCWEPLPDASHTPGEASVPSHFWKVGRGIFFTAVTHPSERMHLPSFALNIWGSLGFPQPKAEIAESRRCYGNVPRPMPLVRKCILWEIVHVLNAHIPHLPWSFSSKVLQLKGFLPPSLSSPHRSLPSLP